MTTHAAPTGTARDALVAGGEGLEEVSKDLTRILGEVHAEGLSGPAAAAAVASRLDWTKIIAKTGAHAASRKVAELLAGSDAFKDPMTKMITILVVENVLAGAAVTGVDQIAAMLGDSSKRPALIKAAVAKVVPTTADPKGGIVAITYHRGSKGSAFTHKAKVDGAGNLVMFPGQAFANTQCGLMADDFAAHELAYPVTTRGGGKDKDGKPRPVEHVQGHRFLVDAPTDMESALRAKPVLCPSCFPQAAASIVTAPKAKTFWQLVDGSEAVKGCLTAIRRHAASSKRSHIVVDHLEDIPKLDFDALRILCESFVGRVTPVADAGGNVVAYDMDDATANEFVKGLDSIGTGLKFSNQATEAAHNAWEEIKHAVGHAKGAAKAKAIVGILAIPAFYLVWGGGTLLAYGWAVFGTEIGGHPLINAGVLAVTMVSAVIWLSVWKGVGGISKAFGGFIHPHVDDHGESVWSQTARSIAALLGVLGLVATVIIGIGRLVGVEDTSNIRMAVLTGMLVTIIAFDQIGARWHLSEKVHHLLEDLAHNNIKTLSLVAVLLALIGIGPLAYVEYVSANTAFMVKVAEQEITVSVPQADGKTVKEEKRKVKYVPSPKGGAFRVEDILGQVAAESAQAGTVCVSKGTDIDLPGHVEQETSEGCPEDKVGYAARERITGRFLDEGPVEYTSLEALYLATYREEVEIEQVVKATMAQPAVQETQVSQTPSQPKATVNVVAPAAASIQPKAKAKVDCSRLSPRARSKQPGC